MLDGDTNLDWEVDADDLANLAAVFGAEGDFHTDFNEDGRVDLEDFAIMRDNFGEGVASAPSGDTAVAAPEPATLALMVLGVPAMLRRRKK